jgi:long-chain acyl-CoA synthetase
VSTLAAHVEPSHRYGSVGRPIEGTTVCLRPTSDDSRSNQLYVTSDTVMKRPIGSVEGRPRNYPAGQRTTATGDVFDQDEDGYLYFKGRLCDYISRKGEKISLAAVRRMASQLPNVTSAKTMIIKHKDGGEDFDLELRLSASPDAELDPREMLRGVLRRTEMPRSIRIELADVASSHAYK